MDYVTSAEGTQIAYHQIGSGRPVVVVVGALSTAASARPLAEAFALAGLRGVSWDRRGRGDSGDTAPYAPEREVEDLRAVILAVGGDAVVLGHSAGAVLALLAAGAGLSMTHLFVSEPPLRFGEDEPPADLADRLQALIDHDQPAEAVLTFQRENVRLPESMIEQLRGSADFAEMLPLARTTVYDTQLIASDSLRRPQCSAPASRQRCFTGSRPHRSSSPPATGSRRPCQSQISWSCLNRTTMTSTPPAPCVRCWLV